MNITTAGLGWVIAAWLAAAIVLDWAGTWFLNQYEVALVRRRPRAAFRPRVTRRWYGPGAHVRLRGTVIADKPDRYLVTGWDAESVSVPWLLLANLDAGDGEPFWGPVTAFAPFTVRKLRPHVERDGRIPVVRLRDYLPPRHPSRYLGGARDAA